jgi:two-component system, LuxR family, sensor kinase FixL
MTQPDAHRQQELETAAKRWKAVIESAVDGIIVIDSRGTVEAFNPAAQRMFGYTEDDVVGRNVSMLMPEPDRSRHDGYLQHHLRTGERRIIGIGREVTGLRRNGEMFPVHLSVGEMEVNGEKHFSGILHDLSRRTELEEKLRESLALARLGEMAAVIAHEVRNPLAAVRGAIQVIGGRLPRDAADASIVNEILTRLDGLNELIQDLLVFARPPKPSMAAIDLRELLATVGNLLTQDPAHRDVRFELTGTTSSLLGDPTLLTIVFQNLFINAAQAMQGRGDLRVHMHRETNMVRVDVIDQGAGIAPEMRTRLFQPFQTTKARGTGLGLATARRLVELHDGRISVRCPPAGGTIVSVEMPSEAPRI